MRTIFAGLQLLAASLVLVMPASAKPKQPVPGAGKPQAITIESWLRARTGSDLTHGRVDACVKVTIPGADIADTGGDPAWTPGASGTYRSTAGNLDAKCGTWTLAGDYRFDGQGHLKHPTAHHVLFARHVLTTTRGTINIQFTGKYTAAMAGAGHWTIKGGTGIYKGLRGTGTWTADGSKFPYFVHTETGRVHWTGNNQS